MQLGWIKVYVRYSYFIINRCNLFLIALRWVYFHLNVAKFKLGHICVCFELKIMQYAWGELWKVQVFRSQTICAKFSIFSIDF